MKGTVCFGGEGGDSACRYFRAEIPAKALRQYGWECHVSEYVLFPETLDGLREFGPRIRGWLGPGHDIEEPADIVTLRVMDDVVIDPETRKGADNYRMSNMAEEIRHAREDGQVVLYDIDDDLWHLPEWSPAHQAMNKIIPYARACDLDVIDANITACDGVITSTEYLGKVLQERFNVPVHVMRPGIDHHVYQPKTRGRPVRVGWMGSMSHHLPHIRTIQTIFDILPHYDAEFVHMGAIDGDNSFMLLRELPCRVRHLPWTYISKLPDHLATIDIGIIPRVAEVFCEGQSVTSGLQYAASGTPFLVSATTEYVDLAAKGIGQACSTLTEWREGLRSLLADSRWRNRRANTAKAKALDHFGMVPTGNRYDRLFSELSRAK